MAGGMIMSDFLLLCVKYFGFVLGLIIVIGVIKFRYRKKNKLKKEEKECTESTKSVKYTFSSVFPNEDIMNETFEILNQNREKEKRFYGKDF